MSDTSLQPGPWREQVHPGREAQLSCPQPLAGSRAKARGTLQTSSWLPGIAASGGCPGAGLRQPLPGPLPSCSPPALPHFWRRLAWLPAPGTRRWAGGWCCCDLAPSRLPISRGRQPKEQSRSLKRNLWLSGGAWCWSPRFKTVCLRASRSPSDARKMHVPVFKPPALKTPLTTQPIKLAFLRQLAHN